MTELVRLKLSDLKERERERKGEREGGRERRKEGACIIPTLQRDQLCPYTHTHTMYTNKH